TLLRKGPINCASASHREIRTECFYSKHGAHYLNDHWMFWDDVRSLLHRPKQMSGAMTGARQLSLFIACLTGIALTVSADELPRKTKMLRESYSDVDVSYDFVTAPDGKRLRTIITKPHDATGKLPAIFVAGWLRATGSGSGHRTKLGRRLHRGRRLGKDMVRAYARD